MKANCSTSLLTTSILIGILFTLIFSTNALVIHNFDPPPKDGNLVLRSSTENTQPVVQAPKPGYSPPGIRDLESSKGEDGQHSIPPPKRIAVTNDDPSKWFKQRWPWRSAHQLNVESDTFHGLGKYQAETPAATVSKVTWLEPKTRLFPAKKDGRTDAGENSSNRVVLDVPNQLHITPNNFRGGGEYQPLPPPGSKLTWSEPITPVSLNNVHGSKYEQPESRKMSELPPPRTTGKKRAPDTAFTGQQNKRLKLSPQPATPSVHHSPSSSPGATEAPSPGPLRIPTSASNSPSSRQSHEGFGDSRETPQRTASLSGSSMSPSSLHNSISGSARVKKTQAPAVDPLHPQRDHAPDLGEQPGMTRLRHSDLPPINTVYIPKITSLNTFGNYRHPLTPPKAPPLGDLNTFFGPNTPDDSSTAHHQSPGSPLLKPQGHTDPSQLPDTTLFGHKELHHIQKITSLPTSENPNRHPLTPSPKAPLLGGSNAFFRSTTPDSDDSPTALHWSPGSPLPKPQHVVSTPSSIQGIPLSPLFRELGEGERGHYYDYYHKE